MNLWIFSNSMNILLEHLYTNVWVIYFQTYSITILPLICILEMGLIFVLKYHSKKMCEASLKICGPKIRNALHADIRESKSIYIFKKGFKFKLFNWPRYVLQLTANKCSWCKFTVPTGAILSSSSSFTCCVYMYYH